MRVLARGGVEDTRLEAKAKDTKNPRPQGQGQPFRGQRTFISEDLTPLRAKLLNYCKNECDKKFVLCHTINGKIRFKKSAVKEGLPQDEDGKDTGTGDWITVTSPDDLFKAGIDVDFEKIKYEPLRYNAL